MGKNNLKSEFSDWWKITVISMLTFAFGFAMTMLITRSTPFETHKEISRLRDRNSVVLKATLEIVRQQEQIPADLLNRLNSLELTLKEILKLKSQYKKEGKSRSKISELTENYRKNSTELRKLKRTIFNEVITSGSTPDIFSYTSEYQLNEDKLQNLKSRTGFLYSSTGGIFLMIVGLIFVIVTWMGIFGIVFFGIAGGLNVLFSTKYQ